MQMYKSLFFEQFVSFQKSKKHFKITIECNERGVLFDLSIELRIFLRLSISSVSTKYDKKVIRGETMAYNKALEEEKWHLWKESEEEELRKQGMDELSIQILREYDWKVFNSDRAFYRRTELLDMRTYLDGRTVDLYDGIPDIKTVEEFLDSIEDPRLYSTLKSLDNATLEVMFYLSKGYTTKDISRLTGFSKNKAEMRVKHLRKKVNKL